MFIKDKRHTALNEALSYSVCTVAGCVIGLINVSVCNYAEPAVWNIAVLMLLTWCELTQQPDALQHHNSVYLD